MGKSSAFTLAEIIITLTIVGMVAAMTVPNMVQDIQDQQYKTAWKKTFAEIDQATRLVLAENGGSFKNQCLEDWDNDCLRNLYLPYLRYIKSCDDAQAFGNCWHKDGGWKILKGIYVSTGYGNTASIILTDGKMIRFALSSNSCADESGTSALMPQCGTLMIDINGFSEPNTQGRDIFQIHIFEDKIMPFGMQGDKYSPATECIKNSSGKGCAALYLYQ